MQFIINGAVFQPRKASAQEDLPSIPDPLADDRLEELEKSIPLFKELGLNTLFVCRPPLFLTTPFYYHIGPLCTL